VGRIAAKAALPIDVRRQQLLSSDDPCPCSERLSIASASLTWSLRHSVAWVAFLGLSTQFKPRTEAPGATQPVREVHKVPEKQILLVWNATCLCFRLPNERILMAEACSFSKAESQL
jgi:hypothetical protein